MVPINGVPRTIAYYAGNFIELVATIKLTPITATGLNGRSLYAAILTELTIQQSLKKICYDINNCIILTDKCSLQEYLPTRKLKENPSLWRVSHVN